MMKISFFSRIMKFAVNARKKSKGITLGEFTRSYADERRKEGEKIYEGRCGSVLGMLKHLETSGGSDIPLKKVDVETVKQFIDYLRSAHDLHKNMKAPGKLSDSTIHLKVNILKSVLREAVRQGLLDQNPFDRLPGSYKIHPHYKEKETLTMEDLITLKQTPCKTPQLKEAVLLSSLTGLRKSDILSLNHDDIIEIEGTPYIYKKIRKTQRWHKVPLSDRPRLPDTAAAEERLQRAGRLLLLPALIPPSERASESMAGGLPYHLQALHIPLPTPYLRLAIAGTGHRPIYYLHTAGA